jgi:DNA primase
LPDGKDPADIIATNPADWKILIDNKKDYIAFHGEITKSRTLRERIISVETHLFPLLAAMQNHVHRDAKLQSIANQLQVSHESIRAEFQKFIQNYGQNTLQNFTSTAQPNTSSVVSESRNSLDTQLDELSIIRTLYASETQSWFDNHADVTTLLAAYTKTISDNQLAAAPMRYESLDETSWQIKLDTLWLRIQQIQIDTDIQKIRASIHLAGDDDSIQNLQQQLLSLQSKKETLVRSLAE